MAKIKIHSKIKNISTNQEETLECMGILDKNKIIYKDNDGINEMNVRENEIVLIKKRNDKTTLKFHRYHLRRKSFKTSSFDQGNCKEEEFYKNHLSD